jgi:hypothetical protein
MLCGDKSDTLRLNTPAPPNRDGPPNTSLGPHGPAAPPVHPSRSPPVKSYTTWVSTITVHGDGDGVAVGVTVRVGVGDVVRVGVGVPVDVDVGVTDGDGVRVGVTVDVGVDDAVALGVGDTHAPSLTNTSTYSTANDWSVGGPRRAPRTSTLTLDELCTTVASTRLTVSTPLPATPPNGFSWDPQM